MNEVRKQREVVAWVEEQGGMVLHGTPFGFEYAYGWETEIMRDFLGIDFFYPIMFVDLSGTEVADLSQLRSLTSLKMLWVGDTQVSDLSPLSSLTQLDQLVLDGTPVDDLSPLAALNELTLLELDDTNVTDLSPLAALTKLELLSLDNTIVTTIEIEKLKQALPQCEIWRGFEQEE